MLFDEPYYLAINEARWHAAHAMLLSLPLPPGASCLDVGCGPGWFARRMVDAGLHVVGIDGRADLIAEARRRVPGAAFLQGDVQGDTLAPALGTSDLVFCFGLLYHVENPFAVIRNLRRWTGRFLMLESMIIPRDEPLVWLVEEGRNETQGLTYMALIPTRSSLVRMLAAAGFRRVYEFTGVIDHEDFVETPERWRRRGVFLATDEVIDSEALKELPVPSTPKYSFARPPGA